MVFLAIRITYAMLSVFDTTDNRWNNLSGSISIFIVMCLMMEYAAMICFIGSGLLIPRIAPNRNLASDTPKAQRQATRDTAKPTYDSQ
jgi:hypothetical protein